MFDDNHVSMIEPRQLCINRRFFGKTEQKTRTNHPETGANLTRFSD